MDGQEQQVQRPRKKGHKMPSLKILKRVAEESAGIHAMIAKKLDVDRVTIWRWAKRSKKFAEILREAEESVLDLGESKLLQNVRAGKSTDIQFLLECKGKRRGWIRRREVTGADGRPLHDVRTEIERINTAQNRNEEALRVANELVEKWHELIYGAEGGDGAGSGPRIPGGNGGFKQ